MRIRQADDGKIFITGEQIRAIAFGYGYCAEHGSDQYFKYDYFDPMTRYNGKKERVWTRTPDHFRWLEFGEYSGLHHENVKMRRTQRIGELKLHFMREDFFAWNYRNEFLVLSKDKKKQNLLREMYEAAKKDPGELCFIEAEYVDPEAEGFCIGRTKFFSSELDKGENA